MNETATELIREAQESLRRVGDSLLDTEGPTVAFMTIGRMYHELGDRFGYPEGSTQEGAA